MLSFDRKGKNFSEVCKLELPAQKSSGPSTDDSYVFAGSNRAAQLIETFTGKVAIFQPSGENSDWVSTHTMPVSTSAPDSGSTGTWLQKMDKPAEFIVPEPYPVGRDGTSPVAVITVADGAGFATRDRLHRVDLSRENLKDLATLARPVFHFIAHH